jgi:uncharacterized integral membrane protein
MCRNIRDRTRTQSTRHQQCYQYDRIIMVDKHRIQAKMIIILILIIMMIYIDVNINNTKIMIPKVQITSILIIIIARLIITSISIKNNNNNNNDNRSKRILTALTENLFQSCNHHADSCHITLIIIAIIHLSILIIIHQ